MHGEEYPLKVSRRNLALAPLLLVQLFQGCGNGAEPRWTLFPATVIWQDPRLDLTRRVPPEKLNRRPPELRRAD